MLTSHLVSRRSSCPPSPAAPHGASPPWSRRAARLAGGLALAALVGCTSAVPAQTPVRFTALDERSLQSLPAVIEFAEGDRIPVRVSMSGNLVETSADAPPILLTVKRRFFVVVDEDGPPQLSLDGRTLDGVDKAGSLSLGIRAEPGQSPEITVGLAQSYHAR